MTYREWVDKWRSDTNTINHDLFRWWLDADAVVRTLRPTTDRDLAALALARRAFVQDLRDRFQPAIEALEIMKAENFAEYTDIVSEREAKGVIVHVNRNTIARNAKHGTNDPPLTIRRGSKREYAHEVELIGPARIVHSPHKPLDCGARVWIEAADAIPKDSTP